MGATGPQGTQGAAAVGGVIASDGTFVRGRGISSSTRTAPGTYQVTFTQDVTNCWYIAQNGSVDTEPGDGNPASVRTARVAGNPNAVMIWIWEDNGHTVNLNDEPFHIEVDC